MIFAKPTKYGAGITLYGDYHDFTDLHETIHDLTRDSPLNGGREDFVLGLAYEIRHAYQGDRDTVRLPSNIQESEPSTYFTVRELWPIFLYQLGLLRWAAGFQPTRREHQANLFRLEACAESALKAYDPFIARRCLEWLTIFQAPHDGYLLSYISNCSLRYVTVGKAGKTRFKNLPEILRMSSSFSNEYRAYEAHMESIAREKGCKPGDLVDMDGWPEFKW
jgi:hypothetical protein